MSPQTQLENSQQLHYTQDPQTAPRHEPSPSSSKETPTFLEERAKYDTTPALRKTAPNTEAIMRKGRTVKVATRYTMNMKNVRNAPVGTEQWR